MVGWEREVGGLGCLAGDVEGKHKAEEEAPGEGTAVTGRGWEEQSSCRRRGRWGREEGEHSTDQFSVGQQQAQGLCPDQWRFLAPLAPLGSTS